MASHLMAVLDFHQQNTGERPVTSKHDAVAIDVVLTRAQQRRDRAALLLLLCLAAYQPYRRRTSSTYR